MDEATTTVHRSWPRLVAGLLAFSLLAFSGCNRPAAGSNDVLTLKPTEPERTQITVLVKHALSINAFEVAVEARFPDIDLVQVGNYTSALNPAEYVSRLEHDDLTDIVMTWPLSFGEEYWNERLIDLAALPFTTRYNVSMLDAISRDGRLYYLPGPAQVRGIIYNKTLFEEKGWQVPTDFEGFVELCHTIEADGIRAIQLGFQNPEVLDTAFVGFGYADCFATPRDAQWINDYLNGTGHFSDHFAPALDTFQTMIDAGIWRPEDLEIDYSEREQLIFTRQCAMIEDSALFARMAPKFGNTDEFALMPFFNPTGTDWARLYMVCYIGLNNHLTEPQNKAKFDKVLALMDYISTPEGQQALSADTGVMYSSLKGVSLPNLPEIANILSALEQGRVAIFPELPGLQDTLRKGLAGMLTAELTTEDVGRMMDEAKLNATQLQTPSEVLGRAERRFSIPETGSFITDVMREFSGCDVALFLDGGKDGRTNQRGVTAKLYEGDVTTWDIQRILPDFQYGEQGQLLTGTMTGANLLTTLEYAIPAGSSSIDFYYASGLKMQFDPFAQPGQRISNVTLTDGSPLDPAREYTLIAMENTVPAELFSSPKNTGVLIGDLLAKAVREQKVIAPADDRRFQVKQP